jgi:TPR repeat protein
MCVMPDSNRKPSPAESQQSHFPHSLLERAAEAGNTTAQQALGRTLTDPNSVDFEPKAGVYWLQQSVEDGNILAKGDLALAYEFGVGVRSDLKEAKALWNDASQADPSLKLPFAEFRMRNGAGFSDQEVAKLIVDAAKSGDVSADLVQATIVLNSAASPVQKTAPLKTLSAIANSSDDKANLAMVALGMEALKAPAGTMDFTAAEKWFKMAAAKGNIERSQNSKRRVRTDPGVLFYQQKGDRARERRGNIR